MCSTLSNLSILWRGIRKCTVYHCVCYKSIFIVSSSTFQLTTIMHITHSNFHEFYHEINYFKHSKQLSSKKYSEYSNKVVSAWLVVTVIATTDHISRMYKYIYIYIGMQDASRLWLKCFFGQYFDPFYAIIFKSDEIYRILESLY